MNSVRVTPQVLRVLNTIINGDARETSGAAISKETGLPSGTLYPILMRLERAGWLKSQWEAGDPAVLGRPRRRFYRVTAKGAAHAREAAKQFAELAAGLAAT
jgi:DNA-binding PadR family transcriptional regulator